MQVYLDLIKEVLQQGIFSEDRTKTGTTSIFVRSTRFNLQEGFPIVTTKKIHFRSVVTELLWFLRGETNIDFLKQNKCRIWNEWANENGEVGPLYGAQWTEWKIKGGHVNQIEQLISNIRKIPHSRRLLVSTWNVEFLPDESKTPQENVSEGKMALAPCHIFFQVYCRNETLSLMFYVRSQDLFLGAPFNIASYALLLHILATQTQKKVGELVWCAGDIHLYNNHKTQAQLQITRKPYTLPQLHIKKNPCYINDYEIDDFELISYRHHDPIHAKVSV